MEAHTMLECVSVLGVCVCVCVCVCVWERDSRGRSAMLPQRKRYISLRLTASKGPKTFRQHSVTRLTNPWPQNYLFQVQTKISPLLLEQEGEMERWISRERWTYIKTKRLGLESSSCPSYYSLFSSRWLSVWLQQLISNLWNHISLTLQLIWTCDGSYVTLS